MQAAYADYFPQFIQKGVDNELLDERLLKQFDLPRLAAAGDAKRLTPQAGRCSCLRLRHSARCFPGAEISHTPGKRTARGDNMKLRHTTLALAATLGGLYGGLRRLLRPYADATRLLRGSTAVRAQARAHPLAQAAGRRREQQVQARQRCQQAMAQLEALDHER